MGFCVCPAVFFQPLHFNSVLSKTYRGVICWDGVTVTAKFRRLPFLVSKCLLYILLSNYIQRDSPLRILVTAYFSFLPLQISLSLFLGNCLFGWWFFSLFIQRRRGLEGMSFCFSLFSGTSVLHFCHMVLFPDFLLTQILPWNSVHWNAVFRDRLPSSWGFNGFYLGHPLRKVWESRKG